MKESKIWRILNTDIPYTPKFSKKTFAISIFTSTAITIVGSYNPSYSSLIIFAEITRIGIVLAMKSLK